MSRRALVLAVACSTITACGGDSTPPSVAPDPSLAAVTTTVQMRVTSTIGGGSDRTDSSTTVRATTTVAVPSTTSTSGPSTTTLPVTTPPPTTQAPSSPTVRTTQAPSTTKPPTTQAPTTTKPPPTTTEPATKTVVDNGFYGVDGVLYTEPGDGARCAGPDLRVRLWVRYSTGETSTPTRIVFGEFGWVMDPSTLGLRLRHIVNGVSDDTGAECYIQYD